MASITAAVQCHCSDSGWMGGNALKGKLKKEINNNKIKIKNANFIKKNLIKNNDKLIFRAKIKYKIAKKNHTESISEWCINGERSSWLCTRSIHRCKKTVTMVLSAWICDCCCPPVWQSAVAHFGPIFSHEIPQWLMHTIRRWSSGKSQLHDWKGPDFCWKLWKCLKLKKSFRFFLTS